MNFAKNRPEFWSLSERKEQDEYPVQRPGVCQCRRDAVRRQSGYDRAVDDMPPLHSGARLAAKLNAKIIVNGNEFNNAGEMSVDDRHLYHEALEALFPPEIATPASEPGETNGEKKLAD